MRAFADQQRQERARAELRRAPAPAPPALGQRAAPRGNCACGGGCPRCAAGPTLQTKLAVSRPGDSEERQADRVAEQVMRADAPGGVARADGAASPQVDAARGGGGGGRPLAQPVREFFEPRFGHGFGDVRVHTDARAARSARSLGALAYTVGADVVFAEGQYAPETQAGRALLAHELAHVVQQRGGAPRVQRKVAPGCTSEEASAIKGAVSQAKTDLGTVINLLAESTLSQAVKNAMWLAFRADSEVVAKDVMGRLTILRNNIELADYTCVNNKHPKYAEKCETEEQTYGFVSGHDVGEEGAREFVGPINFCMPRFANFPKPQQVRGLIHEASHRYLNALDLGYFTTHGDLSVPQCQETARTVTEGPPTEDKSGTAGDTPGERLINADAIGCFVYFAVYAPADFVTTAVNQYRGGELRIWTETREPGSEEFLGDIYTQTGAETDPTFHIAGEPDMGRFEYRWRFEAGGNTYIPRARSGGKTAATFDARNTEVYIGQATRSTLDGRGVEEGTLICEAQLVKPYDPDPKTAKVKRVKKVLKIKQGQDRNDPFR